VKSRDSWLNVLNGGVLLKLQIQPKASRSEVVGPIGEPPRLKIKVAAPPRDGEANEELLRFLKALLGVPLRDLELIRGETSKMKDVLVRGLTPEQIAELTGHKYRL
jgi:uncharacterized protein